MVDGGDTWLTNREGEGNKGYSVFLERERREKMHNGSASFLYFSACFNTDFLM